MTFIHILWHTSTASLVKMILGLYIWVEEWGVRRGWRQAYVGVGILSLVLWTSSDSNSCTWVCVGKCTSTVYNKMIWCSPWCTFGGLRAFCERSVPLWSLSRWSIATPLKLHPLLLMKILGKSRRDVVFSGVPTTLSPTWDSLATDLQHVQLESLFPMDLTLLASRIFLEDKCPQCDQTLGRAFAVRTIRIVVI